MNVALHTLEGFLHLRAGAIGIREDGVLLHHAIGDTHESTRRAHYYRRRFSRYDDPRDGKRVAHACYRRLTRSDDRTQSPWRGWHGHSRRSHFLPIHLADVAWSDEPCIGPEVNLPVE